MARSARSPTQAPKGPPERFPHAESVGFLLSQLGFATSRSFKERLAPLDLDPKQFGMLRYVAAAEGQSQHALGEALQIPPSRMVALVDELEDRGLLERRPDPADRRVRALHLTPKGRQTLERAMEVAIEHEKETCGCLEPGEREELLDVLNRIAEARGLRAGVHPGLKAGGPPD
jgi:DNA-binding MarR family transcriptional regulator